MKFMSSLAMTVSSVVYLQLLIMECVSAKKYVRSHYLTISRYIPTASNSCNTDVSGFHDLPETILLGIFKYFSESELRKNIIPVCRQTYF